MLMVCKMRDCAFCAKQECYIYDPHEKDLCCYHEGDCLGIDGEEREICCVPFLENDEM